MRSLGEFVGYIARAVRTDPARAKTVVRKTTDEQESGHVTLRRTTIDEVEIRDPR